MRTSIGLSLAIGLGLSANVVAAPQMISSPVNKVSLLELYTSEGCDSCPPAENWISSLQQDVRLWKQVVPVTFQVDYWDDGGWRDPPDSHSYTARQQQIAAHADNLAGRVIYTPQFVLDGQDSRDWFNDRPLPLDDLPKIGVLSLTADGREVTVHFSPTIKRDRPLEAHVVLLAFGVDVPVGAGENQGVTLRHDFLVIADTQGSLMLGKDGSYAAALGLPTHLAVKAMRYALAGWVSVANDPTPIQAVGGWSAPIP